MISSSGKLSKRLSDESEEIPARVQFSPRSGNGTLTGISELVDLGGPNKNLWCFAGGFSLTLNIAHITK